MLRLCTLAAWLAALAIASNGLRASEPPAFEPCEIRGGGGNTRQFAQCLTFKQPEDPSSPDGREVALAVAKREAPAPLSTDEPTDALIVINGGPGGASITMMADYWPAFAALGRQRDVIAMDLRGTGLSSPLTCADLEDLSNEPFNGAAMAAATTKCLQAMEANPRFYTTSVAVDDLEALRRALGYDTLTIYGVSYGTRVAQHYLRKYPQHTRALILDGVVPPRLALGAVAITNSQTALEDLFDRCAEDATCAEQFADIEQNLAQARLLLAQPRQVQLAHPTTNQPTDFELSYEHLAASIRFMLYAPESSALIPFIIQQAVSEQNLEPVAAQAIVAIEQLSEALSTGVQASVLCSEDAPYFGALEEDHERLDRTYLTATLIDGINAMCSVWPRGHVDANLREPLTSDHPILLLSGEFDPITPPGYADEVLRGLTNARHLVAPGQGHGVIIRGCVPQLASEFVEDLDVAALDPSCLDNLTTFPFFIDALGPPP